MGLYEQKGPYILEYKLKKTPPLGNPTFDGGHLNNSILAIGRARGVEGYRSTIRFGT